MIARLFIRLTLTAMVFAALPFGIVFLLVFALLALAGALEKVWTT